MATMQIPLFHLVSPSPRQKRLPDMSRRKTHDNAQSAAANARIHSGKSDWYPVILAEARRHREAGITLAEFVEKWNRDHRLDKPFHKISPNDVSGRFSELGERRDLVRAKNADGSTVTRGSRHGIWFLPEFAPKAGAR
jgi:hypothetical protein